MTATYTLEIKRPMLDQALLDSFRSEMLERRRLRTAAAASPARDGDEVYSDVIELVEADDGASGVLDSSAVEAPVGTGYDFDVPKTTVGGYIPSKEVGYAYQKVLQIRLHLMLHTPTIEPTDATLDEFTRIEMYNIDIVDKKKDKKSS